MGLELEKRRLWGSGSGVWNMGDLSHSLWLQRAGCWGGEHEYRRGEGTVGPIAGMF